MIATGKIDNLPVLSFYTDVYFPFYYFVINNLQLPTLRFSPTFLHSQNSSELGWMPVLVKYRSK